MSAAELAGVAGSFLGAFAVGYASGLLFLAVRKLLDAAT